MKKIDVLYFIEHPGRELDMAVAIERVLREKFKLSVRIKSLLYESVTTLITYKPRLIITPSTSFAKGSVANIFFDVYGDNISYINLNFEQYISKATEKLKIPTNKNSREYQHQFCWNENFLNLLRGGGIGEHLLKLTGRPHKTLIEKYYIQNRQPIKVDLAKEHSLNQKMNWVFIAMSDGLAFTEEKKIKTFIESGSDSVLTKSSIAYTRKTSLTMLEWLPVVAEKNIDFQFIVRPHPSISVSVYFEYLDRHAQKTPSNIYVTKTDSALQWLAASDLLITDISTLNIDARIMKIPVATIIVDNGPPEHLDTPDLGSNAIKCKTINDLNNVLELVPDGIVDFNIEPKGLEVDAISITAEEIALIAKKTKHLKFNYVRILFSIILNFRRAAGSIIRLFLMKTGLKNLVRSGIHEDYFNGIVLQKKAADIRYKD